MRITNQMTGEQLDIPPPDFGEVGKFVKERAEQLNAAGKIAEEAIAEFIRRNSMMMGSLAAEVSSHCAIPIAEATQIVLHNAAVSTNNNRIAAENYMADYIDREIDKAKGKHLKPVPRE